MQIGIIGVGGMGAVIARNLASAGCDVRAWNPTSPARATVPGVTFIDDPADAIQAEAVLTALSYDCASRAVVLQPKLLHRARRGPVHVVLSTISVAFARALTRLHEEADLGFGSAPMLGHPQVDKRGELNPLMATT